jgi:hypothetical protein
MKVLIKGTAYEVENVVNKNKRGQEIEFNSQDFDGTSEAELLKVLIDRFEFLGKNTDKLKEVLNEN